MTSTRDATNDRVPRGERMVSVAITRKLGAFTLDVAFELGSGITALLGPSGSGKTLTLRALAGLLRPDRGYIRVGQEVLFDAERGINVPARRRQVGYVFQQYALFPHLSVAENIAFGLHGLSRSERVARVAELLSMVRLESHGDGMPRTLSGGQQQRVALARTLAPRPKLVLLDEPLAALDRPLRHEIGTELRQAHQLVGTPMILVTHDPDEAERIADRVIRISGGRME